MDRWHDSLVGGRPKAVLYRPITRHIGVAGFKISGTRGVPCYTGAIDIDEAVARFDEWFLIIVVGVSSSKAREIVLVHLFHEGVQGRDQNVFEKTWLGCGDVGEPATHD